MKLGQLKKRHRFILKRTGQKFEVLKINGHRCEVKPFDSDIHLLHKNVEVERLKKPTPPRKTSPLNQYADLMLKKISEGETYAVIVYWLLMDHDLSYSESTLRSFICNYRKELKEAGK